MKIDKISNPILKCDTGLCNNNSAFAVATGSYKGSLYLCLSCFKTMQNLFKKVGIKNDE